MGSQQSIVDLSGGQEKSGDRETAAKSSSRSSSRKPAARKTAATESELKGRLHSVFDRVADSVEARGDEELAEILREDRDVMAQGLVSLTRPFLPLRTVIMLGLSVVEPVMAFGRLGRLVVERVLINRAAKHGAPPETDRRDVA